MQQREDLKKYRKVDIYMSNKPINMQPMIKETIKQTKEFFKNKENQIAFEEWKKSKRIKKGD